MKPMFESCCSVWLCPYMEPIPGQAVNQTSPPSAKEAVMRDLHEYQYQVAHQHFLLYVGHYWAGVRSGAWLLRHMVLLSRISQDGECA